MILLIFLIIKIYNHYGELIIFKNLINFDIKNANLFAECNKKIIYYLFMKRNEVAS